MNLKRPNLRGVSLGSRLKGSELKPPDFLADFYYDLRDRRLLPLIALVVVAIAAVPFLLGDRGEGPQVTPPSPGAVGVAGAADARLTVVESTPGLRDYHKRLHGKPTDPFVQRYTGVPGTSQLESTGTGGESEASSGAEAVTSPEPSAGGEAADGGSSPGASGGSPPPSGGDGGSDGNAKKPGLIEFVFDVQISHTQKTTDGGQEMSEPEVRRRVPTLAQLPGKKTPVVTVAGINLHNGKVWFLVSDDVHSLDGDFACITRTPDGLCELLEIELGFPLELVYEANEDPDKVRYRLKVTKIDAVWAGKVGDDSRSSRASFGGSTVSASPTP